MGGEKEQESDKKGKRMYNHPENDQELNRLTKKIISCVEQHKDKVPKGLSMFDKETVKNIEDALRSLEKLLAAEETEIEKLKVGTLLMIDYEDRVRKFAVSVVNLLYPEHEKLKGYTAYQKLLIQKYMAYAFFHVRNSNLPLLKAEQDISSEFYEKLYMGLVAFYEGFYGRFGDNEEAIELLCKFFPESIDRDKYGTQIVSVLFKHVLNAGTPEDRGYAFRGIAQIESYIGNLPDDIVTELLGNYQVDLINSNEVFRHQVYTIIEYSGKSRSDKSVRKFLYLDSVILAWQMQKHVVQRITDNNSNDIFSSMSFTENYITGKIQVCAKPNAYWKYWSYGEMGKRTLHVNGEDILEIRLKSREYIEIVKLDDEGNGEILEFPYAYSDWLLDSYFSKEMEQKLRKLILGSESKYNQMFFSLLYLEHYRGMDNRTIDFDHQFQYDRKLQQLKRQPENTYQIGKFYGQSVRTLSCIVGKNGTGKTSIIDFLRESFFKLLRLIEDYGLPCEEGRIEEEKYREYHVLDEGAKFLIVFYMGAKPFFLTNISGVHRKGAEPFAAGIYNSINEFSKVAYFSNMLRNNQETFFPEGNVWTGSRNEQDKRQIGRSLSGFRQVDYSETESFIRKQKAMIFEQERDFKEDRAEAGGSVNRELCYQLTFLKNMGAEKVRSYLDVDEHKKFKICSRMKGWSEEEFTIQELQEPDRLEQIEKKYLFLSDAQLQYFSSGQYVKFAFLAKLYWFLEGYSKEIERYRSLVGENEFRSEDALLKGETALIFIDEGETYYHPEWQRNYIKTLLEMVNDQEKSFQVQIVITTNSPFILSDILKEDVTYLTKEGERRFDRTLGQNIHSLLKENFFMKYTIGEYAREFIEEIMLCLKNPEKEEGEKREAENGKSGNGEMKTQEKKIKKLIRRYYGQEKEVCSAIQLLIEQIGEPVYRYELEKLSEESYLMKEYREKERLQQLKKEKERIEKEIQKLEKKE